MLYRFLFFSLLLFKPYINTSPLCADSIEQPWLGYTPTDRFAPLTQLSAQALLGYEEQLVPYMTARGVTDEKAIETFCHEDLFHIAHALSLLFEQDSSPILHNLLGEHHSLIEGHNVQIDHAGRELFGPISFYLPLFKQIAPQLGLINLRNIVFPSAQVVKVLQAHDPSVKGVTIGRVYFQNPEDGKIRFIELFQASLQDGQSPQNFMATKERISLLTTLKSNATFTPIDHLSIELNTQAEVQCIHQRMHQLSSETLMPLKTEISYNSSDGSTQTVALLRDSTEAPFNRVVEFVHYSKQD